MKELKTVVIDSVGLHARPATISVNIANRFKSQVSITYDDHTVNMKSILGVMSLGIPSQAEITITCEGEDEELAIETISSILKEQNVIE
ncbi:MAG: HPr family phosphocarrier protein [Erysipelotrichaceae bacterium]|jgi:phosphocarrier protein|nr:HPr family phosphocarrier protein [Erysipelotrichaceae bacterium]